MPALITRWGVPLLLAAITLAVYLTTLSGVHTFDALSYIRDVDEQAGFFWHPHHLLYSPTGWLFWQGWRLLGYAGNSELPLEALNSLAGAAIGVGLYRLTLKLTGKWWAAATTAGLLLFNYGAWYFSVEVEVYLLALIWLLLTLVLLIELVTKPRRRTAPLLGLCVGMAALYHQTNGLLVPLVIAAVLLSPVPWRERVKQLVIAGALAGGVVALGYAVIAVGVNGYRTLSDVRDWMFFFINTGWWGRAVRDRWTDLGAGLGNSISTINALPYWIAIVTILVLGLPSAARKWPRIVALCALWVAIYGGFFAWWEGDNIEFWIASLMPLWLLVGLSVARIGAFFARFRASAQHVGAIAIVLPLLLAWHNYPIVERRGDETKDLQRRLSASVRAQTNPDDMIVSPGGVMELYLPYYEGRRNVHTLNGTLFVNQGDIPKALAQLGDEINTGLYAGLTVMVGKEALTLQEKFQRYPITQPQLDAFWQPYKPAMRPAIEFENETYFWRIPSATEKAKTDGWQWQSFAWGWQATNIDAQQFANGWCFNPQIDPMLVSPRLSIAAGDFRAIEVRMRSTAQNAEAQLFFADQNGAMADERSVRWTLTNDGTAQTYTLPLSDTPGWSGAITGLRLDPVALGDGTDASRTCVESIKLVP